MANRRKDTDYLDTTPLTRPVDSVFHFKGQSIAVHRMATATCSACVFKNDICSKTIPIHGLCTAVSRSDKQNVIFISLGAQMLYRAMAGK